MILADVLHRLSLFRLVKVMTKGFAVITKQTFVICDNPNILPIVFYHVADGDQVF